MLFYPQVSENPDLKNTIAFSVSMNMHLKHIVGCKISICSSVLVHGYQDSAYGVWLGEGDKQYDYGITSMVKPC